MTNTQIPHSFTPGTQAKAQEVNANFIALASGIDNAKEYTTTEISRMDKKADDKALTLANKNLDNATSITNCILEIPNGSTTYSGATLTVKSGMKVLLPDGRNEDGTLKNIEYTLDEDKTLTNPDYRFKYWYITQDGIFPVNTDKFIVKRLEEVPGNKWVVFDPHKNKCYKRASDNGTFTEVPFTIIAKTKTNKANATITSLTLHEPYELIKRSDIDSLACVVETYKNGVSWYRIYEDDWVEQGGWTWGGTITLMVPYTNNYYNITLTVTDDSTNANYFNLAANYRNNKTFQIFKVGYGGSVFWSARGYLYVP